MFNSDNNGFTMPVMPAYGGNGGNNGSFLGGDGIWAILLFALLFGNGGWGFGGGFGGGMGGFAADGAMLYPWMNQAEITTDGFRDQMLNTSIQGIQSAVTSGFGDTQLGIAGVNQNICQTGNNVMSAVSGAQNAITSQMYTNQISDLERSFAAQTANTQGMSNLSSQLAQCCCDNRLATCQTQNTIQNEGNATRFADANNTRDIITNATSNTQAILDKLCQLELDGVKREVEAKNDRILDLQNQLNLATMRESQTAQNAFIQQGLTNEVDALYNRLSNCPVPTTPVYGRTPIFTCNDNNGCRCGGNTFYN